LDKRRSKAALALTASRWILADWQETGRHEKYVIATTWLVPKLVGKIKFTEWASDGEMRDPAFVGLRTAKKKRARRCPRTA